MVKASVLAVAAAALIAGGAPPLRAQDAQSERLARCLKLAATYERYVGKSGNIILPMVSVEIAVAIERCRQGDPGDGIELLERTLRLHGFRP